MSKVELPKTKRVPKHIKEITFAFDIATRKTGYCFLIDGKPWLTKNGVVSFGNIDMVKKEQYKGFDTIDGKRVEVIKKRDKEYATYGNRMFHGSYASVNKLSNLVFQIIQELNTLVGKKETKIDKINLVAEISEIPNGSFGRSGQSITSVRKLALYTGYVMYAIANIFDIAGFHLIDKTTVKFVAPQEWQQRVGFVKKDREASKEQSLARANELIKKWGIKQVITNDDTADAINLATVANEVRDTLYVRTMNNATGKSKKQLEVEISRLSGKILEYTTKATKAKQEHLENISWAMQVDRYQLSTKEKTKQTKYLKFDYFIEKDKDPLNFLTPAQSKQYESFVKEKAQKQELLVNMRKKKVYVN